MGDLVFFERLENAGGTAEAVRAAASGVLGWALAPKKAAAGTSDCVVLGARIHVVAGAVEGEPPHLVLTILEDKADRWRQDIRDTLRGDRRTVVMDRSTTLAVVHRQMLGAGP